MWLRGYVTGKGPFLRPRSLLVVQFAWVLPYLLLSNYLERSLLPFRLVCYTEPQFLEVQRPVRENRNECIRYFFPERRPDRTCHFNRSVRHILSPPLHTLRGLERVMVIRSAPTAHAYRHYIRETWKPLVEQWMPVLFVSGTSKQHSLHEEQAQFGDILQFDFADSYQNLTMKMMSIYRFVLDNTAAEQIVVINDDTIVNATSLLRVCDEQMLYQGHSYILGKVSRGYPRLFFPWLPWYVPSAVYPHKCYPPFVQGSSFVISRTAASSILNHICEFPFVHLDDVMLGIVSNCLNIRNVHRDGFDNHYLERFTVFHYQYTRYTTDEMRDSFSRIKHDVYILHSRFELQRDYPVSRFIHCGLVR